MDVSAVVRTAMDQLICEMERDMMNTEDAADNLEVFSAILWLESPERRYPVDITQLCILDSQTPLKVLLSELTQRLESVNKVGGAQPVKVKMVLVLCELIKLLPMIGRIADVDLCINQILGMHLGSKALGPAKNLILLAIDDVVYLAVVAGSNPVVSIMGNPDVFAVLDGLPAATNNAATFRCALGQMTSLLARVPVDQRSVFVIRLYDFVSGFVTHYPRVHEKLIADGLNQAQMVIDEMLKWKATPDTEHLCLFAALMPFCPSMVQAMAKSGKKGNPLSAVFHGISDWRKKKDLARYSIACAFLELMDALVIATPERANDFKPFKEFLDKFKAKFDTYMFRHKVKKDGHICGKLLTSWLPRYTAVNFAMHKASGDKNPCEVTTYTLNSIKKPDGRANIVTFLKLIFRGYPKQIDINSLLGDNTLFNDLSLHFGETLNKLATETGCDTAIVDEAMAIVRFFTCDSWKFSPFSLMVLKGAETAPVSISVQMQKFRAANQTADAMSRIVRSMIQVIACTTLSLVRPFIQFVRTFMTYESSWEEQLSIMKNADVMRMVTDIARTFKQQVEKAFLLASPGLSHLPTLIYRFLVWSEMVLKRTLEKERTPIDQNYISSITSSLLMLSAVCSDEVVQRCEEVLAKILLMYSGDLYGWLPSKVWEIGGNTGIEAVKHVVAAWFGHVAKQLESEKVKVTIPSLSTTPVAFDTTRERIAVIAAYLCRHIYQLSSTTIPGTDITSLETAFFETCVKYISCSGFTDELFTASFKYLSSYSFQNFLSIINSQIESTALRGTKCQFEKIFFWHNVVNIFASLLQSPSGTKADRDFVCGSIIAIIPAFLSLLQMRVFEGSDSSTYMEKFIDDLYKMCTMFDKNEPKKSSDTWKTIVYTSFEICLMYMGDRRKSWIEMIFAYLPELMLNMDFEYTGAASYVDEVSSRSSAAKYIHYVIRACSVLTMWSGSKAIAIASQTIFDNIMISNSEIAWKVYMKAASTEATFIRAMLMVSLSLLFNTVCTPMLRSDLMNIDLLRQNREPKMSAASIIGAGLGGVRRADSRRAELLREQRSSSTLGQPSGQTVMTEMEAKILQIETHFTRNPRGVPQPKANYEHLCEILLKNDFELIRSSTVTDLDFVQSAIACCIAFNVHDKLFETMTQLFKENKASLSQENCYQRFYTAWFKQMCEGWPFSCMTWTYKCAIKNFIANLKLPPQFLYYFHRFFEIIDDREVSESLFQWCFLKPFMHDSWSYGSSLKPRDDPSEFLQALLENQRFKPFLEALLNSETYYTVIHPQNFAHAYRSVARHVFKRAPPCEIIYPKEKSYLNKVSFAEMKSTDYTSLSRCRLVISVGQTNLGDAYLLIVRNLPEVSNDALSTYFLAHFSAAMTPIELFVDLAGASESTFDTFDKFMRGTPKEFLGRIRSVTFLRLSFSAARGMMKRAWDLNIKVRFCDDLAEVLKGERICFPRKYFPRKLDHHYWFSVTAMDMPCRLYIGDGEFVLCGDVIVLTSYSATAVLRIKACDIKAIETNDESVTLTYSECGKQAQLTISTESAKYIKAAWESMQKRGVTLCEKSFFMGLEESMSPSQRVQAIAMTLYILARHRSIVDRSAMQLFHAAIQNKESARMILDVYVQERGELDLQQLMLDVSSTDMFDDIMFYMSSYVSVEHPQTCFHLLPLFVKFMNESRNKSSISAAGSKIIGLCGNDETLMVLERQFWLEIESPVALECLVPLVIVADLPAHASRRILQSLCLKNSAVLGRLVVSHYLDGTVRRRRFDKWISERQVFSVCRMLPFHAPEFVNADLPVLLFTSVISSIYADAELAADTSCLLESSFTTLVNTGHQKVAKNATKLVTLIRSSKAEDPMVILHVGEAIAKQIGTDVRDIYQNLVQKPNSLENPNFWYIRAAADVHANGGDYATACHFMEIIPEMFSMDATFGYQKLALAFRCFSRLIDTFPRDSRWPLHLFWAAILCILHSSKQLRLSALEFLTVLCDFAMKKCGFMSLEEFKNYRHDNINHCISTCEDDLGARFDDHFAFAFIQFLTKAIEETETRSSAIRLLKTCIDHMSRRSRIAIFYILPLIVFAPEECSGVLASLKGKHQLIPEFVAAKVKKMPQESGLIIGYLASMFGCSPQIDLIADCLITGAHECPNVFARVKPMLVEKCFKMLLLYQTQSSKIDKISRVAGAYLCLEDPTGTKSLGLRINVNDIVDDNLKTYIIGVINYIGAHLDKT